MARTVSDGHTCGVRISSSGGGTIGICLGLVAAVLGCTGGSGGCPHKAGVATRPADAEPLWTATGREVPEVAPFEEVMGAYMRERGISAGSLAVVDGGRLVLARGYTWAPRGAEPTQPTSMFRIASLSKPLTAVGVLRLVEKGLVELDEPIGKWIDLSRWTDRRIERVTLRHLLSHRGGWDRASSFDPMFRDRIVADALGQSLPTTPQMIVDYMAGQKLDYEPGTRYAYSNFGYCLIGRIIGRVTGETYEEYMRREILAPLGIREMRVGHSLRADRLPGEVEYVDGLSRVGESVMGHRGPARVPQPYGAFNLHTMDAHGGWIASAVDLARFLIALEGAHGPPLLSPATRAQMWARPPGVPQTDLTYYALGWQVRPVAGGVNAWHTGSLPGTYTLMVRLASGRAWVALFNKRSEGKGQPPSSSIDRMLHEAAGRVSRWPDGQVEP